MATHGSKSAIREILGYLRIVEHWALHNTCGKDDFVTRWVVICLIYCILAMVHGRKAYR